jgi:hypothetical protein
LFQSLQPFKPFKSASLSALPLNVAEPKEFFAREGLQLEALPIPGGTDSHLVG